MKILALDPATRTGVAHSCGYRDLWVLGTSFDMHPGHRLLQLRAHIHATARRYGVDMIAFEDAAFGSKGQFLTQQFHSQLRGVIVLTAAELRVPFRCYKPASIKKFATGYGRADKEQIIRACQRHFGEDITDDNIADALMILHLAKQDGEPEGWTPPTKSQKRRQRKAAKVPTLF